MSLLQTLCHMWTIRRGLSSGGGSEQEGTRMTTWLLFLNTSSPIVKMETVICMKGDQVQLPHPGGKQCLSLTLI